MSLTREADQNTAGGLNSGSSVSGAPVVVVSSSRKKSSVQQQQHKKGSSGGSDSASRAGSQRTVAPRTLRTGTVPGPGNNSSGELKGGVLRLKVSGGATAAVDGGGGGDSDQVPQQDRNQVKGRQELEKKYVIPSSAFY